MKNYSNSRSSYNDIRKRLIIVLLTLFTVVSIIVAAFCSLSTNKVSADVHFSDKYLQGQTIDLPEAQLSNGLVSATAKPIVVFPDGKVYELSKINLNQLGEYEIRYYAEVGSTILYKNFSFYTVAAMYSVTGADSFVKYGVHEYVTDGTAGINVGLKGGDKFLYNKIINLEQLGAEKSIVDLFVTPTKIGYNDFSELLITLTDIYDEEKYITISVRSAPEQYKGSAYLKASACGQVLSGIHHATNKVRTDIYGTQTVFSFYGKSSSAIEDDTFELYYDSVEKKVYGKEISTNPIYSNLIIDLDEKKYFSEQWEGFTTGEVLLSIEAARYVNSTAEFVITNIAGQNLDGSVLDDFDAPEIKIDFSGEDEENLPYGVVGVPYKLFGANAIDLYTRNPVVKTRVFRNYFTDKKAEFDCSKGYFIPSVAGNYVMEYTSVDECGNISTLTIPIIVKNDVEQMSMDIKSDFEQMKAGDPISLQEITISGGSGQKKLRYIAVDSNDVSTELINGETRLEKGIYNIVVEATDYIGAVHEGMYQLEVLENDDPVIIKEPLLLKYYISGAKYVMPSVEAYDYSANQVEPIVAEISVSEGNGEVIDNTFIPLSDGVESATIKYTLKTSTGKKELLYPIIIVDTGYTAKLEVQKYFVGDINASLVDGVKGVVLSTDKKASCDFITPLQQEFNISFAVKDNNFSRVNIILTDFNDSTNRIMFSYFRGDKNTSSSQFSVNDGIKTFVDSNFYLSNSMFNLSYSNKDKVVQFGQQEGVFVKEDVSKISKLSDKFYLTIEIEEVNALSSIYVAEINGQRFSYNTVSDRIGPNIYLADDLVTNYSLNEVVKIASIVSFDVLDPEIKLGIEVTDENGNFLYTIDGRELSGEYLVDDYYLKLEKYGRYIIKFSAMDTSNRSNEFTYVLFVRDDVAPIIKVNGKVPTSIKINKTINLPGAVAEDNVSSNLKVSTYIITPHGKMIYISDGKFVADMLGDYLIRYICYDDAYNGAMIDYRISVKGK